MADKTIPDLPEIQVIDTNTSFLVVDNGVQTYKIKPVNIPGLPKTPVVVNDLELFVTGATIAATAPQVRAYAYADKNGLWKLNFNIRLLLVSTTADFFSVYIEGIFFHIEADTQLVSVNTDGANFNNFIGVTQPGFNGIDIRRDAAASSDYSRINIFGDVYLKEKPAWADDVSSPGDGFIPGGGGSGAVDSVNGFTGDVNLSTSDIPEGSRPYFTEPRARTAAVQDVITPGVADRAPSQKAVSNALDLRQAVSQKNQAGGYPGLGGDGKLSLSVIPGAILGALIYQDAWSAAGGTYPPSPSKGYYWIINVAGTIGGVTYNVKDWLVYNGSSWSKVSGSESPSVLSVNAKTGSVVLDTDDLAEGAGNKFFTDSRARGAAVQDAIADGVTNIAPSQNAVFDALASAASATTTALNDKEDKSAKGAANGYAPLGADQKVPSANLPPVAPGSGEKNFFLKGTNDATGWTASNTGIAVATESTVANLPDNATQLTGIKITRGSGTDYVVLLPDGKRPRIDDANLGQKLKVQFDMKYAGSAGDFSIRVFAFSADTGGVGTEIPVRNANIPGNWTGQKQATFQHIASLPFIEVRIYGNAGTGTLYINNFLIGPGQVWMGAAIGEPILYTPNASRNQGLGTLGATGLTWERVGSDMIISGFMTLGTVPSATQGRVALPDGYTIASLNGSGQVLGRWSRNVGTAPNVKGGVFLGFTGAAYLAISSDDYDVAANPFTAQTSDTVWSSTNVIGFHAVRVPIAEWQGQGTVNMGAGAQPVYASNSSTSTASDSTSFQYGYDGALIQNFAPTLLAAVSKRVRSPYPNPKFQVLQFFINGQWVEFFPVQFKDDGTARYGAQVAPVSGSATDFDVNFFTRATANSSDTWTAYNTIRWRVVFADTPAAVGFGQANSNESGMVKPRKGQTDLTISSAQAGFTKVRAQGIYYQDQDGNHRLKFNISATFTSATVTGFNLSISGVVFKNITNHYQACSGVWRNNVVTPRAYTVPNTANIGFDSASASAEVGIHVSGDVELESKPSWA